jgi:hypothetical protein
MVSKYSSKLVSGTASRVEIESYYDLGRDVAVLVVFPFVFAFGAALVYQGLNGILDPKGWSGALAVIAFGLLLCAGIGAGALSVFRPRPSGFVLTPDGFEKCFRKSFGMKSPSVHLPVSALLGVNIEVKYIDFMSVWTQCRGERLDLFEGAPSECELVAELVSAMYGWTASLSTRDMSGERGGMISKVAVSQSFPLGSEPALSSGDDPPVQAFFPKRGNHFALVRKSGRIGSIAIERIDRFRIVELPNVGGIAPNGLRFARPALVVEMAVEGEGNLIAGFEWLPDNSDGKQVGAPPTMPSVQFLMRYLAGWTGRPCDEGSDARNAALMRLG